MRGLVRLLLMFGPMIFRQVQRYQQKKEREQYQRGNRRQIEPPRQRRQNTPPSPPPVKKKPELSEDEKNFQMEEDEFLLDNTILEEYGAAPDAELESEVLPAENMEEQENPLPKNDDIESEDIDLKSIFFEDDEDEKS